MKLDLVSNNATNIAQAIIHNAVKGGQLHGVQWPDWATHAVVTAIGPQVATWPFQTLYVHFNRSASEMNALLHDWALYEQEQKSPVHRMVYEWDWGPQHLKELDRSAEHILNPEHKFCAFQSKTQPMSMERWWREHGSQMDGNDQM